MISAMMARSRSHRCRWAVSAICAHVARNAVTGTESRMTECCVNNWLIEMRCLPLSKRLIAFDCSNFSPLPLCSVPPRSEAPDSSTSDHIVSQG